MNEDRETQTNTPKDEEKDGGIERTWREYIQKQHELAKAKLPGGRRRTIG